jgi:hypothetical protein
MRRHLIIVVLGLLPFTPAAAQRPTPEEQRKNLDTAREIALHYAGKLPDFICTENVERTDSISASIMQADRLTIQLSYFGQKEKYKLLTINGKTTDQSLESLEGMISGGEFGSLQLGVFDPSSGADFQWKSASELRKRRAAVYTYRVTRAKSHFMVGSRAQAGNLVAVAAGYHGEVVLDSQTGKVLRLTASADDIPSDSEVLQSSVEVDYDFIDVAGHSYLLPSHSVSHMERSHRQIANTVTFVDYRKFAADSTIDFHPAAR